MVFNFLPPRTRRRCALCGEMFFDGVFMYLEEETFKMVIAATPLISIDLLVKNSAGQYLLGYRNNRPAQGYWFVPGGRILKNESITDAFKRLCQQELGGEYSLSDAKSHGVFEHFYDDSVFDQTVSTHYVVLAYEIVINENNLCLPTEQHSRFKWLLNDQILQTEDVHLHSRWYFDNRN